MTTEYLTHIGFIVLGLGAVLAMVVSAIKFVKEVRAPGAADTKASPDELKNLREEMAEKYRILEEKVDHLIDIQKGQLTNLSKRVALFEKNCPNNNCGVDE